MEKEKLFQLVWPFFLLLLVPASEGNVYCLIDKTHTMCKYHDAGKECGPNFIQKIPPQDAIVAILDWHNQIRQRVALGKETQTQQPLPSATNMMKMEWDEELAAIAQAHANLCEMKHDCEKCREVKGNRFKVGQNIGLGVYSGKNLPADINWIRLMTGWYDGEAQLFPKSYIDKYVFGRWGHFSQVIWWNSRLVGCGASTHTKGNRSYHILVCNYGRAGNIRDAKVYEEGPPCSNCPKDAQCDTTYNALCAPAKKVTSEETFNTDDEYIYNDGKKYSEKNMTEVQS